jgi:hypothetical protein
MIGMYAGDPPKAYFLLESSACEIQPTPVENRGPAIRIGNPNHDGRGINHPPKTRFALPQRVFGSSLLLHNYRQRHDWNTDNHQEHLHGEDTGVIGWGGCR